MIETPEPTAAPEGAEEGGPIRAVLDAPADISDPFGSDPYAAPTDRPPMAGGSRLDEDGPETSTGDVTAGGDAVFRDKNVYYGVLTTGPREPAPLTVAASTLDEVRHVFVEPSGYRDLDFTEPLLILRVARGQGGGTAALRLLLDKRVETVRELAPDAVLRRLTTDVLTPGGYLLRNAGPAVLDELTEFEVQRLCADLKETGGWLVLTVDPAARLADGVPSRFLDDLGEPPPARAVVAAHLARRLRNSARHAGKTDPILDEIRIAQLLTEAQGKVGLAAGFARVLADAVLADDLSPERLSRQFEELSTHGIEQWFDGLEPSLRCFTVALAVLHSHTYDVVADAATALEQALGGARPPEPPPAPFGPARSERLMEARARVARVPRVTRYGPAPAEVVSFVDPTLPDRVLRRVWTEFPATRTTLLAWLGDLVAHPVAAIRFGAARSVGVVGLLSFEHVTRHPVAGWAASGKATERQAAAVAVAVGAQDAAVSAAARRMLFEWHLDRSVPHLRNTAARAYGYLGSVDIDAALDAFDHLAAETQPGLRQIIANSVTLLIVRGDEKTALQVLKRLRRWVTGAPVVPPLGSRRYDRDPDAPAPDVDTEVRQANGFLSFLTVAADSVLLEPVDDRPDATAWHGLLWLAARNRPISTVLADLWCDALVGPTVGESAMSVLTSWAARIDPDPVGRDAFVGLMRTAAGAPERARLRSTISRQAGAWARDPGHGAMRVGRELKAALEEQKGQS